VFFVGRVYWRISFGCSGLNEHVDGNHRHVESVNDGPNINSHVEKIKAPKNQDF
jgi:hypothetical protein